jgi:hypothetical protein
MNKIILLLLVTIGLSGCIAPQSFLEPKYRGVTYQDIKAPATPIPVQLTVVGQTNGALNDRATEYWRRQVERVLSASRFFDPNQAATGAKLNITINNIGDRGSAAGKGFVTGLTFGAVGSLVTDGYIMTVEYRDSSGRVMTKTYQHAIYTAIGNATPPPGISPVTLAEAPALVAEDMLLHFLKDLNTATTTP